MPYRNARKGFTLVELLTVVGLIALLAAMLLPALNKAQQMARRTQCEANLHQIGIAMHLYTFTYKGLIAKVTQFGLWESPVGTPVSNVKLASYWGCKYLPMLTKIERDPTRNLEAGQRGARGIFRCPSAMQMDADLDGFGNSNYNPDQPAHYGVNYFISATKIVSWKNPSETVFCQDSVEHRIEGSDDSLSAWGHPTNMRQWRAGGGSYFPNAIYEYYRHNKYCNVLWLDGHVSGIKESLGKDVPRRWYDGL